MRGRRLLSDRMVRMGRVVRLVRGAVLVAICLRRCSLRLILAGVRRRWIRARFPACRHIRVDRLARGRAKAVPIRVMRLVMLALARLVQLWGRRRIAFVEGTHRRSVAKIRIMRMVGAVARSVMICYLVESILVPDRVMKACVALVKRGSKHGVTVERYRRRCCAARRTRSWIVN